eukprot:CAMPEP_0119359818 /NCGR_PEP_ID=MMETSP1334-20130426/7610_1 /TAXON_ID=127549 /ORGANISM="Calcidiscus leptoporus, Strain RCC1130" /LENGTH=50 /DNA_ID=CAMNT_0007374551 /DNA_START=85 /DNA_END=233 /DNA_ORIENTATION=+
MTGLLTAGACDSVNCGAAAPAASEGFELGGIGRVREWPAAHRDVRFEKRG